MTEEVWDRLFRERAWGRWPAEEVVRTVARTGRSGLRVLEVGCGAGAQLWYLAHDGHHPVGLDFAPAALAQAGVRLTEESMSVPLVRADVLRLPVAPAAFDLVVDVECFAHLDGEGAGAAWQDAARVLAPEGLLLSIGFTAATTGAESGVRRGPHTMHDLTEGPLAGLGTVTFLDEPRTESLAAGVGLRIEDLQWRRRTVGPAHDAVEEMIVLARR